MTTDISAAIYIADLTAMELTVNVSEVDVSKVYVGQPAKVVLDAFPDKTFSGQVSRIVLRDQRRRVAGGRHDVQAVEVGEDRPDQVVLASHSDQSHALLAEHYPAKAWLLREMPYQPNRAVLHSDASVLPRRKSLWSAWNYQSGVTELNERPVAVHYLINRLQPLPTETPVIVSLNPLQDPDPATVHGEFHDSHPVFTRQATALQRKISATNGHDGIWLAGAWLGYGFHEDGLASALRVVRQLNAMNPARALADAA